MTTAEAVQPAPRLPGLGALRGPVAGQWQALLLLCTLPWIIFLINPNWPFQGFAHMDPWYYFGSFIHFPHYQRLIPNYAGERLTWILPGVFCDRLFGPVYGVLALHLVYYEISVLSIYYLAARVANRQTGLAVALLMGCHPFFIGSNGWTYLDGACIAYLLLTFVCLLKSGQPHSRLYLFLAGVAWASLFYTYIAWVVLSPCCFIFYEFISKPKSLKPLSWAFFKGLLTNIGLFVLGMCALTLALSVINACLYGPGKGFFFARNIDFALGNFIQQQAVHQPVLTTYLWVRTAGWLVFPFLTAVLSVGVLLQHVRGVLTLNRRELGTVLLYSYCFWILVIQSVVAGPILAFDYYASILIPLVYLVLAVTMVRVPATLPLANVSVVLFLCCFICVADLCKVSWYTIGSRWGLLPHYLLGLVGICCFLLRPHRTVSWLVGILFLSSATHGLIPIYPNNAWTVSYNGLAATRRVAEAVKTIEGRLPYDKYPVFWFDNFTNPYTTEFRAIMCSFLTHGVSMYRYPTVDKVYGPGTIIVLLNNKPDVFEVGNLAMSKVGMPLSLQAQERIAFDGVSYWLTFAQVQPRIEAP